MCRLAWRKFWKLATVWKSKEISLSLKLHLFDSLIISIILFYNAQTWATTKAMKKEIDFLSTSCCYETLGIRRIDKVRNEEVLKGVRRNNLSNLLYKRQLRSLEDWIRKDDIIARFALYINNKGRNQQKRPRLNYNKQIENITRITTAELQRKALNREKWRRDVVGRFGPQLPRWRSNFINLCPLPLPEIIKSHKSFDDFRGNRS